MNNDKFSKDDIRRELVANALCFFVVYRDKDGIRTLRQTNIDVDREAIAVLDELNTLTYELTKWLAERHGVPTVERVNIEDYYGE